MTSIPLGPSRTPEYQPETPSAGPPPDVTVLCTTFNRKDDLKALLDSLWDQEAPGIRWEVLVVDNKSTDGTREMVQAELAAGRTDLRYLFEARQGRGHALNSGLAALRSEYYALLDDDETVGPDYLRTVVRILRERPDISCVSGRLLPNWQAPPPAWLTRRHWSPVALVDYGPAPVTTGRSNPLCLLAGNFRTADVLEAGGYDPELGSDGQQVGGVEDADLLERLYQAGKQGLYTPELTVSHKVAANRLTRAYHRRWHRGHGRYHALMRSPSMEASARAILGIPGHLLRAAIGDLAAWLGNVVRGRWEDAFAAELRLRFFLGFTTTRLGDRRGARARPSRSRRPGQ